MTHRPNVLVPPPGAPPRKPPLPRGTLEEGRHGTRPRPSQLTPNPTTRHVIIRAPPEDDVLDSHLSLMRNLL